MIDVNTFLFEFKVRPAGAEGLHTSINRPGSNEKREHGDTRCQTTSAYVVPVRISITGKLGVHEPLALAVKL